jgi:DDE superfamily endonuclease
MTEPRNGNSRPLAFLTHPRQIRAGGGGKCMPLNLPPSAMAVSVKLHEKADQRIDRHGNAYSSAACRASLNPAARRRGPAGPGHQHRFLHPGPRSPAERPHLGPRLVASPPGGAGARRRGGRVSIAGVACYRPGDGPHLCYTLHVYRRRKGEAKGFTWADYRDLILAAHRGPSAPLVWVWDNLTIHLASELAGFAKENKAWLRVYRLPAYTPDLNPAEPVWSLLKRSMANFAAADLDGCLAGTGLIIEPW